MREVTVTGIGCGVGVAAVLAITPEQLRRRAECVRVFDRKSQADTNRVRDLLGPDGPGDVDMSRYPIVVETTRPVTFKRGESFVILDRTTLNPRLLQVVASSDAPAAEAAREAAARRIAEGDAIASGRAAREAEVERNRELAQQAADPSTGSGPAPPTVDTTAGGDTAKSAAAGEGTMTEAGAAPPRSRRKSAQEAGAEASLDV